MQQLVLIIHVLIAIAMIILVLLQYGKGADAGATFGSGSSSTMFGSAGSLPILMKITTLLLILFFMTSIALSYFTSKAQKQNNALDIAPAESTVFTPSTPDTKTKEGPQNSNNPVNQNNKAGVVK